MIILRLDPKETDTMFFKTTEKARKYLEKRTDRDELLIVTGLISEYHMSMFSDNPKEDAEYNPIATMIYNKFKKTDKELKRKVFGTVYLMNERGLYSDFARDDLTNLVKLIHELTPEKRRYLKENEFSILKSIGKMN